MLLFIIISVSQSCLTLCDRMVYSTPGFSAHHQLPELLKLMTIELVMPSNHLILCHPLLLLYGHKYLFCGIVTNQIQTNDISLTNYRFIEMCDKKEYVLMTFLDPGFEGKFETSWLLHEAMDHQEDVLIKKMWQVRSFSSFPTSWWSKSKFIKHSHHILFLLFFF